MNEDKIKELEAQVENAKKMVSDLQVEREYLRKKLACANESVAEYQRVRDALLKQVEAGDELVQAVAAWTAAKNQS